MCRCLGQQARNFHVRQHCAAEGEQGDHRNGAGQQGKAEGLADTAHMDRGDHGEHADLHRPSAKAQDRFGIGRDEGRRGAGADGQRERTGDADQIADEGAEGGLGVGEHPAGVRHGGGQLGNAQRQSAAEHGHQQGGDEHVHPAAGGEPVVPAGKLSGNHQRDSQSGHLWPTQGTFLEHSNLPDPEGRY
ncbi:hypothetical protein D3C81_1442690 [compost metagenome]